MRTRLRIGPIDARSLLGAFVSTWLALASPAVAEEPLHVRIDQLLQSAHPGGQTAPASDADFVRRAYLVLTGVIPTSAQARAFFADKSAEKRVQLIDQLLGSRDFTRWIATRFDVMLMERRPEKHVKIAPWRQFLEESFAANKPWDQLVRELLTADGADEKTRAAARWSLEREGDPHLLTRDVGRIFLGRDMACAQCHDHPRIDDYLQRDYYGIEGFFSRTHLFQPDPNKPAVLGERADGEVAWTSVFTKVGGSSRPRLPGEGEIAEPTLAAADLWLVPPNDKDKNVRPVPKFSRRAQLAVLLTDGHHPAFRRNIANRLWYLMFGRGLVDPLDLHHSANPPSNPALLDLLAESIGAMKFDMKAFIREVALSRAFEQSIDLPAPAPEIAAAAAERLPMLEQEAKALGETATASEEAFTKARQAIMLAQREAEPLTAELKKQDAAVAEAKKAADAAIAGAKKAEETLAAKRDIQKALAEAASKSNEAAAKVPEAPELAQAAKTFQAKAEQATTEVAAVEKDVTTKKADADSKAQALTTAQQTTAPARAKVDEAGAGIAKLQSSLDAAAARKQSDRTKARYAARLLSEAKTVVAWAPVAAADRAAREAAQRTEAASAAARQAVDRLTAEIMEGPSKTASLELAANNAAAQVATSRDAVTHRAAAVTALTEAAAKTAEAAAKLAKDAEVQSAAATVKAKADAGATELTALQRAAAEAPAKAEAATKLVSDARAALDKAAADLVVAQQQTPPLEVEAKAAREKAAETAVPGARACEALSTAWTESFASSALCPLLPEQLCRSVMQATGFLEQQRTQTAEEWDKKNPLSEADKANPAKQLERTAAIEKALNDKLRPHEDQYVRSFGGAAGQPQTEFFATPEQALYFENAGVLRGWSGLLSARLLSLKEPGGIAEELYLSALTRPPTEVEIADLTRTLAQRAPDKKSEALTDLVWALVTSVEFRFVH